MADNTQEQPAAMGMVPFALPAETNTTSATTSFATPTDAELEARKRLNDAIGTATVPGTPGVAPTPLIPETGLTPMIPATPGVAPTPAVPGTGLIGSQEEINAANVAKAANDAAQADAVAKLKAEQLKQANDLAAENRRQELEAYEHKKSLQKDYEGFKFHDFWSEQPVTTKIAAVIASALLGYAGDHRDLVGDIARNDFEKQKAHLDVIGKKLEMAGVNMQDVQRFNQDSQTRLLAGHSAAIQSMIDQYQSQAAKIGTKQAKAIADQATANLMKDKATNDIALEKDLRTQHGSSSGHTVNTTAPTKGREAEAGAFNSAAALKAMQAPLTPKGHDRVDDAVKAQLEDDATKAKDGVASEAKSMFDFGTRLKDLTPAERSVAEAKYGLTNAYAKRANTPPAGFFETAIPHRKDSPDAQARKFNNLRNNITADMPPVAPTKGQPAATPTPVVAPKAAPKTVPLPGGKTATLQPNGKYRIE